MLLDIPSRQDFEAIQAQLKAVLDLLARAPAAVADDYLSVEEVAQYVHFNRKTVEKWVEAGEFNQGGKKIYLPARQYSGRLRIKRSDVDAFGQGIGVLAPSVHGDLMPVKKTKKSASVSSERALQKVA